MCQPAHRSEKSGQCIDLKSSGVASSMRSTLLPFNTCWIAAYIFFWPNTEGLAPCRSGGIYFMSSTVSASPKTIRADWGDVFSQRIAADTMYQVMPDARLRSKAYAV